jgi:type IV secretory pathway VirB2 component (pilin)
MEHLAAHRSPLDRLRRSEAGEGVISAAIAVLVMAFIGVMMWVAFSGSFDRAAGSVDDRIDQIGS